MYTSHGVRRNSSASTGSPPSKSPTEAPSATWRARASASILPSLRIAPRASEAAHRGAELLHDARGPGPDVAVALHDEARTPTA
jgi:hypothetical protein